MVKANLLPAHDVTLTVSADTARSGVTRERTVANASRTSLAALLVGPTNLAQLANATPREPGTVHLVDPVDDDNSWIFVLSGGAHDNLT